MEQPLYKDPDYVQGQIAGLKAMILAVAQLLPKDDFAEAFFQRLESQRIAHLGQSVSEARLVALDHLEKEIRAILE